MGHHSSFDCCVSEVLRYVIHFGIVHSEPSILGYPHDYGNLWIETHFLSPGARLYPTESHAMHWAASQALQGHKALGAPAKKKRTTVLEYRQTGHACNLTYPNLMHKMLLFHTISYIFILFHTISYYFYLYMYILYYIGGCFSSIWPNSPLHLDCFVDFSLHAFAYFEGKPELGGIFSWLLLGCLFAWSSSLWWKMLVDVG